MGEGLSLGLVYRYHKLGDAKQRTRTRLQVQGSEVQNPFSWVKVKGLSSTPTPTPNSRGESVSWPFNCGSL